MDLTQVTWLVISREFEGFKSITLWGLSSPPPWQVSCSFADRKWSHFHWSHRGVLRGWWLDAECQFSGDHALHVAIHSQQRFICPWALGMNKTIDYSSHLRMANSGNQHSSMPSLAEGVQPLVGKLGVVARKTNRYRWCKAWDLHGFMFSTDMTTGFDKLSNNSWAFFRYVSILFAFLCFFVLKATLRHLCNRFVGW